MTNGQTQTSLSCPRISIEKQSPNMLPAKHAEKNRIPKKRKCSESNSNKLNLNKSKSSLLKKSPTATNRAFSTKRKLQPGDTLEIIISSETATKYGLVSLNKEARSFFPSRKGRLPIGN